MIQICLAFLLGLSSLFWLENGQQSLILSVISLSSILALFFYKQRFNSTLLALFLGILWATTSANLWLNTASQLLAEPKVANIKGYVCSIPVQHQSTSNFSTNSNSAIRLSFDFCLTSLEQQAISFYQANKLKLNLYQADKEMVKQLTAGSYWQFSAKLKPVHGRLNPGGFDYEKWLISEGYIGTGYIKQQQPMANVFALKSYYQTIRQTVYTALDRVILNNESKGLILALAMGEKSSISAEQWQAVKDSGTSHLLAISGLHIGIAAVWSYYFFLFIFSRIRFISQQVPAQRIADIGSLVGALAIALLSGLGYPAQRALIMLAVYLYSRWSGRHLSLANILALSIVIIVALQPLAILTVSFWLSILAVTIIVLLLSYKQSTNSQYSTFKGWLRINWYLFIGLMPITWVVFDSISIVGFAANLVLIPLTSFVTMPIIFIGLLLLMISNPLASLFFYLADKLIIVTHKVQQFLSDANQFASVSSLPLTLFILMFIATLLLLLPSKVPGKTLVLPISLICILFFFQKPSKDQFKMVVFDIGQGLAIHLSVANKQLVYDTGYGNKDFSMAQTTLLPYFKREGIEHLDALIISHNDADHVGGYTAIKDNLTIDKLYVGNKLKQFENNHFSNSDTSNKNISIDSVPIEHFSTTISRNSGSSLATSRLINNEQIDCHSAASWQWQNVHFNFLPHIADVSSKNRNNTSCVLLISINEQSILLTGDIEKKAEKKLLESGIEPTDILVVAHHGSLTSSIDDFVERVRPKYAIFSTGYANQWNFPRPEVVKRYSNLGANNYITHQHGAIIIELNEDKKLMVSTERGRRTHFWQTQSE